jgi:hypothetical protein
MKLFAQNAAETDDTKVPPFSGPSRYSDNSAMYAAGFPFAGLLNSATFNGFLHRITVALDRKLHCNADNIPGLVVERTSRYNTANEVRDLNYTDTENYILDAYKDTFLDARVRPRLTKQDVVKDFFSSALRNGTYLPSVEATRSKALFCGTELPPLLVETIRGQTFLRTTPAVSEPREILRTSSY